MMKAGKGFTLTEVLIVVVIIAILAAFVIPRFFGQDERAITSEAVDFLGAIRMAEATYRLEQAVPAYTDVQADLDVDAWTSTHFTYGVTIPEGGATFLATATRSAGRCSGRTITIDQDGTFGGDHPLGPTPGTGVCNN